MRILMTKPEFDALPEEGKWAIVYNLNPEPEPSDADRQITQLLDDKPAVVVPKEPIVPTGGSNG